MSHTLIVYRDGNLIKVLSETDAVLPGVVISEFDRKLSYQYKTCDWRGSVQYTKKLLYLYDETTGVASTSIGLSKQVSDIITSCGFSIKYIDDTPADKNRVREDPRWDLVSFLSFRPRQRDCLDAITKAMCGLIVAPTGFGKTFLIGALGKLYPKARIHICTKSVDIARRIYADLRKMIPNVGMIGGGSKEDLARILVITADSLEKSPGDCDFFFFDECHQAAAETYMTAILRIYRYARRFGFTATPEGRSDGADPVLSMLFGPQIFNVSYQEGVELGLVVPIEVRWIPCRSRIESSSNLRTTMQRKRFNIWNNKERNKLIADDIHKNCTDGSVLVLVETIEHAVRLWEYLPEFVLCYSDMKNEDLLEYQKDGLLPFSYIPLGKKERLRLCDDFAAGRVTRVISTDVWSTGVDFPSLSTVYSVSGRVSRILTTQGAGRASRLFSGKTHGSVVDVQDLFSAEFSAYAKKRHETYAKLGWKQEGYRDSL